MSDDKDGKDGKGQELSTEDRFKALEAKIDELSGTNDRLSKELDKTRKEAAKRRVERNSRDEKLKALAAELGINPDGNESDADLMKEIKALRREVESGKLRDRFQRVAKKVGADPDLTQAVLAQRGSLGDVDSDDALEALVKEAVDNNPRLRAEQPTSVGDDQQGARGGGGGKTMNDLIRGAAGR